MKAILISIRPQWVAKILNGEKTIEIRKRFPSDYVGWVYIYCTKDTKYKYGGLAHFGYGGNYCVHLNNNKMVDDFMDFKLGNLNDVSWTIQNDSKERVVARFWCDKVEELMFLEGLYDQLDRGYCTDTLDNAQVEIKSCVPQEKIIDYLYSKGKGYAIHITNLEIFDKPKYLCDFSKPYEKEFEGDTLREHLLSRAPQSWCYVEVD